MPDMVTSIEFSQWWELYPRKVGKLAAQKAFVAARKKATTEERWELRLYVAGETPRVPCEWQD